MLFLKLPSHRQARQHAKQQVLRFGMFDQRPIRLHPDRFNDPGLPHPRPGPHRPCRSLRHPHLPGQFRQPLPKQENLRLPLQQERRLYQRDVSLHGGEGTLAHVLGCGLYHRAGGKHRGVCDEFQWRRRDGVL